jgi:hypothetical protein
MADRKCTLSSLTVKILTARQYGGQASDQQKKTIDAIILAAGKIIDEKFHVLPKFQPIAYLEWAAG